jgi:hypothetical protein
MSQSTQQERFQAKACPGLDPGWGPVREGKTRQTTNLDPRFDSIETEKALVPILRYSSPVPWISAIAISLVLWSLIIWRAFAALS